MMSLLKLFHQARITSPQCIQVMSPTRSLILPKMRTESAMIVSRSYHEVSISEGEIEEKFIKGWGKGGQKVNTTSNCVELHHKPTGISVKCHKTRSLSRNRVLARRLLTEKLDLFYNGKESALAQEIAKKRKLKANYARKRRIKEMAQLSCASNVDKPITIKTQKGSDLDTEP